MDQQGGGSHKRKRPNLSPTPSPPSSSPPARPPSKKARHESRAENDLSLRLSDSNSDEKGAGPEKRPDNSKIPPTVTQAPSRTFPLALGSAHQVVDDTNSPIKARLRTVSAPPPPTRAAPAPPAPDTASRPDLVSAPTVATAPPRQQASPPAPAPQQAPNQAPQQRAPQQHGRIAQPLAASVAPLVFEWTPLPAANGEVNTGSMRLGVLGGAQTITIDYNEMMRTNVLIPRTVPGKARKAWASVVAEAMAQASKKEGLLPNLLPILILNNKAKVRK